MVHIPTHHINVEVVNKLDFLYREEGKRKFKHDFKSKFLLIMSLSDNRFLYSLNSNFSKEVLDTLEMIYIVSSRIEQEIMNTHI